MTAMFVVIFLDQWLKEKKHYTALIGVLSSAVCLLIFGADSFMIPTMATRFLPFLLFSSKRPTPQYIQYLGKAIVVVVMLLVQLVF